MVESSVTLSSAKNMERFVFFEGIKRKLGAVTTRPGQVGARGDEHYTKSGLWRNKWHDYDVIGSLIETKWERHK